MGKTMLQEAFSVVVIEERDLVVSKKDMDVCGSCQYALLVSEAGWKVGTNLE